MRRMVLLLITVLCAATEMFAQEQKEINKQTEIVTQRNILIPNAFTPNGDGKNDVFKLINVSRAQLIEFKIFNRWGTAMFNTVDPEEGWDGRYRNQEQPVGVYGYCIRIKYSDGIIETYRGTITLIR
ncbi:hypothetical protein D3C72_688850 [compost metagenome]